MAFGGQEHRIFKEMMAMRERGYHMGSHLPIAVRSWSGWLSDEGFTVHQVDMDGVPNYFGGASRRSGASCAKGISMC